MSRRFPEHIICMIGVCVMLVTGCESARTASHTADTDRNDNPGENARDSFALRPLSGENRAGDPEVQLGRKLFNDVRLSRDDSLSCATCHDVGAGGDDGLPVAIGIEGNVGTRNTPTVLNAALNFSQFWDGRARTLSDQLHGPIGNPLEMATTWEQIIGKLGSDASLVSAFRNIYPDGLTKGNIVRAVVAYEKALTTPDSPFDRYLRGDRSALSADARRGYAYFLDLGCISCHQGRNVGGNMYQRFGVMQSLVVDTVEEPNPDLGRFNVTNRPEDRHFFKVPSLRNVAETAPYFHNGSAETLEEAVRVMATYQLGRPISDEQVQALVAFLDSLTGIVDERLL